MILKMYTVTFSEGLFRTNRGGQCPCPRTPVDYRVAAATLTGATAANICAKLQIPGRAHHLVSAYIVDILQPLKIDWNAWVTLSFFFFSSMLRLLRVRSKIRSRTEKVILITITWEVLIKTNINKVV